MGSKRGAVFLVSFVCLVTPVCAAGPLQPKPLRIFISPECMEEFYGMPWPKEWTKVKQKRPSYVPWDPSRAKPMVYKDPQTAVSFYVESDGRHLVAIGSDGKLLWVRNPFEDRGLCPYRSPRPVLIAVKAADPMEIKAYLKNPHAGLNARDRYIAITFDSSQFGLVNQRTGDFFWEGQN